jgi:putative hemolysin
MEAKDNSEPPGRSNPRKGLLFFLKKLFQKNSYSRLSSSQRDALIEKSIEEFSSSISLEDNKLEETAKEMIHGIIDLSETAVKEIMVPRVDMVGIEEGTVLRDIIELVKKTGHSRFPLYKESLDNIKGVLYIKDIFVDGSNSGEAMLDTKARPPYFVPENKKVSELLMELRKQKVHLAIVVDEYGGTAGLVTLEDILEEIVGEIEDEYDLEEQAIKKIDDTHYSVKGGLALYELNEELNLKLPEDQFETVGGVIYDIVGSLPEQGITVDYQGLKFTAEKVEGQRITRVLVELPPGENINKQHGAGK